MSIGRMLNSCAAVMAGFWANLQSSKQNFHWFWVVAPNSNRKQAILPMMVLATPVRREHLSANIWLAPKGGGQGPREV
jgi:hypothetical protein